MNTPSMEESYSSDSEFWQSLEKSVLSSKPSKKPNHIDPTPSPQLLVSEKDRLLKTILNIRDSKEVELQTLQIKLENSSKKELILKINEVKQDFLKEFASLRKSYTDSQTIILEKNRKISELVETIVNQETLISSLRIALENKAKSPKTKKFEEQVLAEELINVKTQLLLYKDLASELKGEVQTYKTLFKQLNEEIQHLKSAQNSEKNINILDSNSLVQKFAQEKQELKQEFDRYRQEVEKEVELREMINFRHLQSISVLQEELKHLKNMNNSEKMKNLDADSENQIMLERPKAKSVPRYSANLHGKIPSHYSYKEYKAAIPESCRNSNTPFRSSGRSTKMEILPPKSTFLSIPTEPRQKFFKSSVLFTAKN